MVQFPQFHMTIRASESEPACHAKCREAQKLAFHSGHSAAKACSSAMALTVIVNLTLVFKLAVGVGSPSLSAWSC